MYIIQVLLHAIKIIFAKRGHVLFYLENPLERIAIDKKSPRKKKDFSPVFTTSMKKNT